MNGILKTQKTDPGDVTDQRGESHECAEFVIPKGIEAVSGNGEPDVPCLPRFEPPEHEVSLPREDEKKHAAVEEHGSFSRAPVRSKAELGGCAARNWRTNRGRSGMLFTV